MKTGKLHFKINTVIFVTCLVIAIIFGAFLYPFEIRRRHSQIKTIHILLDGAYEQKKEDLANELFGRKKQALKQSLEDLIKIEGIKAAGVYLPDGQTYLCTDPALSHPITKGMQAALSRSAMFSIDPFESPHLGVYAREIKELGHKIGYLKIFYDLTTLEFMPRSSVMIFLGLLAATLALITALLHLMLTRFVIKPVAMLQNAIRSIQEGGPGETVDLAVGDEIGEMGAAFNEMSLKMHESQIALKKAEEKYRSIFENAIEGIFQSTPGKGRYLTVNPSMAHILGYDSPDELLQLESITDQMYVEPEDRKEMAGVLSDKGSISGFETRLYKKDRTQIWISITARCVYDDNRNLLYYEGSFVDVTERKEREKAEQERNAAESASRAKSEFLASMSHEIRTPMHAILGFADLLDSMISDSRQKQYIAAIQSGGKSLLTLINDILDLSKIEAGKLDIRYEPVSLDSIFKDMNQMFSLNAMQKGLELITELSPDIPDGLLMDETRIRQILFNLVGNAMKYTESGYISLTAEKEDTAVPDTVDLVIRVQDTGIGIHPDLKDRIFDAFVQKDGGEKVKIEGTGLGLAISKNLVEIMGGVISVESTPGTGSLFEIRFKNLACHQPCRVESNESCFVEDIVFEKAFILVADDMEINRVLIKSFFQDTNLTIIEAENGEQAFVSAINHLPDLILMDIKMPVLNGYESAAMIRKDVRTKNIPIIALTASGMVDEREKLMNNDFDDYLIRPFVRRELVYKLCRFIRHENPKTTLLETGMEQSPDGDYIPRHVLEKLPEIIRQLEDDLAGEWESIRRRRCIQDIENFGNRIRSLGEQWHIQRLSGFGERLLFHAGNFDIDRIQESLEAYPDLIENLKQRRDNNAL